MKEEHESLRNEFRAKVKAAFDSGLDYVRSSETKGIYIGKYMNWPSLSFWPNGMPNLSVSFFSAGPTKYQDAFRPSPGREAPDIPKFNALVEYVRANAYLRDRLFPESQAKKPDLTDIDRKLADILSNINTGGTS
ncbi:MAG TPA: hypothetical protein VK464_03485 [Symbiobacteriaceae bacterium]|nr:hypothetical protein [Symbiobacteriaceae bacterium]